MPPKSKPKYREGFNFKRLFSKKQPPKLKGWRCTVIKHVLTHLTDEDVPASSSALTETANVSVQNTHSIQEPAIPSVPAANGNIPGNSLRALAHFLTLRMQIQ